MCNKRLSLSQSNPCQDAERLFKIADKNGDGKIQFAEFVRHVMGRSHDPTSGEAQSMLHERFLVTSSAPS